MRANVPSWVWCFGDTSSRSYELPSAMCACGSVISTPDVKALILSSLNTCASWTTGPKKPDRRTSFLTLTDIIFDEIGIGVSYYNRLQCSVELRQRIMWLFNFSFQSHLALFWSYPPKRAKKSSWVKKDERSAENTGFTPLYLARLCSFTVTWTQKVTSISRVLYFLI